MRLGRPLHGLDMLRHSHSGRVHWQRDDLLQSPTSMLSTLLMVRCAGEARASNHGPPKTQALFSPIGRTSSSRWQRGCVVRGSSLRAEHLTMRRLMKRSGSKFCNAQRRVRAAEDFRPEREAEPGPGSAVDVAVGDFGQIVDDLAVPAGEIGAHRFLIVDVGERRRERAARGEGDRAGAVVERDGELAAPPPCWRSCAPRKGRRTRRGRS